MKPYVKFLLACFGMGMVCGKIYDWGKEEAYNEMSQMLTETIKDFEKEFDKEV